MALTSQANAERKFTCRECGAISVEKSNGQCFCDQNCNNAWSRRRAKRAIQLYDIFMEMRYHRAGAKGLWTLACRLAEEWRDEDRRIRKDLKSWKDPAYITEERVYLTGKRGRI